MPDKWRTLPDGALLALPVAAFHIAVASVELKFRSAQSIIDDLSGEKPIPSLKKYTVLSSKLRLIRWAILTSSRLLPWNSSCLVHSMAASHWLKRHNISHDFHLGVERNPDDKVSGHAWVSVDDFDVTPGNKSGAYVPIYSTNEIGEVTYWP